MNSTPGNNSCKFFFKKRAHKRRHNFKKTCFSVTGQKLQISENDAYVVRRGFKLPHRLFSFYSRYPVYNELKVTLISRMVSYEGAVRNYLRTSVRNLAEAGFYYCGFSNSITCYLCGLSIQNFYRLNNPFAFHFYCNSHCSHVVLVKGPKYVEKLKLGHPDKNETINIVSKSEDSVCVVCKSKPIELLFLPCHHVCSCATCASNLLACPICRCVINSFTHVYIN